MERDGLLVGPYEEAAKMRVVESWYREGVPKGFGKELFQPDLDRIQDNLEMAMERFPCLADGNIQSVVSGNICLVFIVTNHVDSILNCAKTN